MLYHAKMVNLGNNRCHQHGGVESSPGAGYARTVDGTQEIYTFQLTQSTAAFRLWTAPPSKRIFKDDPLPTATGNEIKVYAAQNEFEPFQIAVNPTASGPLAVTLPSKPKVAKVRRRRYQI
ncbi:MAG: hypothetical protein R3E79_11085 [Caldilineaceae bacterium]